MAQGEDDPPDSAQDTSNVCNADAPNAFPDDDGSVHHNNINCIADAGIVQGFEDGTYGPSQDVSRAQMATYIVGLVETATGEALPEGGDAFTDDDGSVHETNINKLANAGIVQGRGGGIYDPGGSVDRAAMATFIGNAVDYADDGEINGSQPPSTDQDFFVDDEATVHEDNINRIVAVAIALGQDDDNYAPNNNTTRAQMASFIAQAWAYLEAEVVGGDLESLTINDNDGDGVLSQGDTVVAGFGQPVGLESTFSLTDEDDESTTLSDEEGNEADDGVTAATFEHETDDNTTVVITVDEEVDVEGTADEGTTTQEVEGAIDGEVQATGCTGIFADPNEDNVRDEGEEDVECRGESATVEEPEEPALDGEVEELPELVQADVEEIDTTGADAGVTVRYMFDKDVGGKTPVEGLFHVIDFDGTRHDGTNAEVVSNGNEQSVDVEFRTTDLNSESEVAELSVATVDEGAVEDDDENLNPIGDAPLEGTGAGDELDAGITDAPDLTGLSGFDDVTPAAGPFAGMDRTEVDFELDEEGDNLIADGYHIVEQDGTVHDCTIVDGDGEDTHTASCPEFDEDDAARGYMDEGTVEEEGGGADNPLHAEAINDDGQTEDPDLSRATIEFFPRGSRDDQATFEFDQTVICDDFGVGPADDGECDRPLRFGVYTVDGDTITATEAEEDSSRVILATFDDGDLDEAVGGFVEMGAVEDTDGDENRPDELGVQNEGLSRDRGTTDGPDFDSAVLEVERGATGNIREVTLIAGFDEDPENILDDTDTIVVYNEDGDGFEATSCDIEDDTIECDDFNEWTPAEGGGAGGTAADDDDVAEAVLATVDNGVIDDDEGDENPEGAEAIEVEEV